MEFSVNYSDEFEKNDFIQQQEMIMPVGLQQL